MQKPIPTIAELTALVTDQGAEIQRLRTELTKIVFLVDAVVQHTAYELALRPALKPVNNLIH